MNRTVHDLLAVWRYAERLLESLPEGSADRSRVAWEVLRLRLAYRLVTDPHRSTADRWSRSAGATRVVTEARMAMRTVEQALPRTCQPEYQAVEDRSLASRPSPVLAGHPVSAAAGRDS